MNIKRHIPNAITCGNLLCGCLGILFTGGCRFDIAFFLILLAAIFDFFDGFAARMLKVTSPIGKDLDSLADMVTFGVLPGFIMYKMIGLSIIHYQKNLEIDIFSTFRIGEHTLEELGRMNVSLFELYLPFIAFIIPIFSAIRLAKFNNDKRQSDSFIGVPTPANALLIGSMGFLLFAKFCSSMDLNNSYKFIYNDYSLIALTLVTSYLLVAELPLFALKFKNFGWADNKIRYVFLIISLILLILFQFIAIPFIIFLYIVLSVINNITNKTKTLEHPNT